MHKTKATQHKGNIIESLSSFEQYIGTRVNNDVHLQKKYLYNMNTNQLLVDYVGRLETLQQDNNHICKTTGIPQTELRVENISDKKDFCKYYNNETKAIGKRVFKDDIQTFDYKFEAY